eukprot:m.88598 g.88598  ORF g.88598 m.88598 type:complete len:63 (+) comp36582_c0_seq7:601-789(+)
MSTKGQVIARAKGHNGVIFSMQFNSASSQLCSVSDDRTVRIWSLDFANDFTCGKSQMFASVM